jgi:YfiH family protein
VSRPELIEVVTGAPARAVFTTRRGGVSVGALSALNLGSDCGDADSAVRANRQGVCDAVGLEARDVSLGRQVHGARVRAVDAPSRPGLFTGALRGWPEGDALATRRRGLGLMVLGADCLPVLLWRRDEPSVAAAHAGWRGLVGGVLAAAVRALSGDGRPERIGGAVGPGIGPCCYPVSADVRDRFAAAFGEAVVRPPAVDLAAAARQALVAEGVEPSAIATVEACTSCEPGRFYSFRRDGEPCGRQGGLVWATG